ncbi:MAG: citrate synthase [Thermaerobacter sp.]|nr:citrate synthase [Thermaerobacter sp.]
MADDTYHPGLEGVTATETAISYLDVEHETILIRGYDLLKLATSVDYLSVAHLLLEERLPSADEHAAFRRNLAEQQAVPPQIWTILRQLGPHTHLMDALRTAISALATFDPTVSGVPADHLDGQLRTLLASMPVIVANMYHIRENRPLATPDPALSYAANFLAMITGHRPNPLQERAFDQLLTVYSEHELPNSTFAAIVIASTLSDTYGALTGAVASLKGPLHGGANEAVMRMLREMQTAEQAEPYLLAKLAQKERIMGFGHRVYMKQADPRAVLMKNLLAQLVSSPQEHELYQICLTGEAVMLREKGLYPNLDYYAAPVYDLLGVPIDLYTPIFFAARTAGLLAHIREQYRHNRLFRPRVRYIGPALGDVAS